MRIIKLALVLLIPAIFAGCYDDPDRDGLRGDADCAPYDPTNKCPVADTGDADTDADADSDTDADSDADTDVDTGETGETGETAEPCEELVWNRDADGDGFGDPNVVTENCEPAPDGYVADGTDCDDDDAMSYPGAPEACDGADNDCDGEADESASNVWFLDYDRDGYGAGDGVEVVCDGSSDSLVDNDEDCDDSVADVYPGADELCNGIDDNCEGSVDEDAVDRGTMWDDDDGDGYGDDSAGSFLSCPADGFVTVPGDCNDADSSVSPVAAEACNGTDDDCDGAVPANETDDDGDGYSECAGNDCDDAVSSSYTGAPESCDGVDNDCDGTVDESDAGDVATWYHDADGDGFGNANESFASCSAPAGYVSDDTDCDDANGDVNPGAIEMCNDLDDDCDGRVDVAAADASVWSTDNDGDGYGAGSYDYPNWVASCTQPDGYVADFSDCDDADFDVNPDAAEVYDDFVDNDCNGTIDDSGIACYPDTDHDGYGDYTGGVYEETGVCDAGYVDHDSDCDDSNSTTNPSGDDPYGDGVDSDCDGSAT